MVDEESVVSEFESAKSMVSTVLASDERARNDDLWLILQVWQRQQKIKLFVPYDKLGEMFRPETLSRVRRFLQNDSGLFLPTDPQVLVRRRVRADLVKKYYADNEGFVEDWQNLRYGVK